MASLEVIDKEENEDITMENLSIEQEKDDFSLSTSSDINNIFICRLCLKIKQTPSIDVNEKLRPIIKSCLPGIVLEITSQKPQICKSCNNHLKVFMKFQDYVWNKQKSLLKYWLSKNDDSVKVDIRDFCNNKTRKIGKFVEDKKKLYFLQKGAYVPFSTILKQPFPLEEKKSSFMPSLVHSPNGDGKLIPTLYCENLPDFLVALTPIDKIKAALDKEKASAAQNVAGTSQSNVGNAVADTVIDVDKKGSDKITSSKLPKGTNKKKSPIVKDYLIPQFHDDKQAITYENKQKKSLSKSTNTDLMSGGTLTEISEENNEKSPEKPNCPIKNDAKITWKENIKNILETVHKKNVSNDKNVASSNFENFDHFLMNNSDNNIDYQPENNDCEDITLAELRDQFVTNNLENNSEENSEFDNSNFGNSTFEEDFTTEHMMEDYTEDLTYMDDESEITNFNIDINMLSNKQNVEDLINNIPEINYITDVPEYVQVNRFSHDDLNVIKKQMVNSEVKQNEHKKKDERDQMIEKQIDEILQKNESVVNSDIYHSNKSKNHNEDKNKTQNEVSDEETKLYEKQYVEPTYKKRNRNRKCEEEDSDECSQNYIAIGDQQEDEEHIFQNVDPIPSAAAIRLLKRQSKTANPPVVKLPPNIIETNKRGLQFLSDLQKKQKGNVKPKILRKTKKLSPEQDELTETLLKTMSITDKTDGKKYIGGDKTLKGKPAFPELKMHKYDDDGHYLEDHDYTAYSPFTQNNMFFGYNKEKVYCAICNFLHEVVSHTYHMEVHKKKEDLVCYFHGKPLTYNNVFEFNEHMMTHRRPCCICYKTVTKEFFEHHENLHKTSEPMKTIRTIQKVDDEMEYGVKPSKVHIRKRPSLHENSDPVKKIKIETESFSFENTAQENTDQDPLLIEEDSNQEWTDAPFLITNICTIKEEPLDAIDPVDPLDISGDPLSIPTETVSTNDFPFNIKPDPDGPQIFTGPSTSSYPSTSGSIDMPSTSTSKTIRMKEVDKLPGLDYTSQNVINMNAFTKYLENDAEDDDVPPVEKEPKNRRDDGSVTLKERKKASEYQKTYRARVKAKRDNPASHLNTEPRKRKTTAEYMRTYRARKKAKRDNLDSKRKSCDAFLASFV